MITYTLEICSSLPRRLTDRRCAFLRSQSFLPSLCVAHSILPHCFPSLYPYPSPPAVLSLLFPTCPFALLPFCPPSCCVDVVVFPPRCQRHCLSHDQGLLRTHPINAFRSCRARKPVESNIILSIPLTCEGALWVTYSPPSPI